MEKKRGSLRYSIPHRLVTLTRMKITKATMRKVIREPMKCPTRKGPATMVSHSMPGRTRVTIGMTRSSTSALTKAPRYIARMKATANPMTLYFERKSLNSFHSPFGGGEGGLVSSNSLIRFSSSNILSSLDMLHRDLIVTALLFLTFMISLKVDPENARAQVVLSAFATAGIPLTAVGGTWFEWGTFVITAVLVTLICVVAIVFIGGWGGK